MADINLPRRSFLFGFAGAAALIAAPKLILHRVPTIYGDGVEDDWEGLTALFNGMPVRLDSSETFSPHFSNGLPIELRGGIYRLSRTLKLPKCFSVIENCWFIGDGALVNSPTLSLPPDSLTIPQSCRVGRRQLCTCHTKENDVIREPDRPALEDDHREAVSPHLPEPVMRGLRQMTMDLERIAEDAGRMANRARALLAAIELEIEDAELSAHRD